MAINQIKNRREKLNNCQKHTVDILEQGKSMEYNDMRLVPEYYNMRLYGWIESLPSS
jgi:hypothetical protein